MSKELADMGARKLRPATVEGNQLNAARLAAEQVEREHRNFPILGLSAAGLAGFRNVTANVGDLAAAAAARKKLQAAAAPRQVVDARLEVVADATSVRPESTPRGRIIAPTRTV